MELDRIYNQDMLIGIRSIPTESIDCIVSDVPYLIQKRGDSFLSGIFVGLDSKRRLAGGGGIINKLQRIWILTHFTIKTAV